MQGTSCPSESLFSKAGELVRSKRSLLSGNLVEKLLFLNHQITFNKNIN